MSRPIGVTKEMQYHDIEHASAVSRYIEKLESEVSRMKKDAESIDLQFDKVIRDRDHWEDKATMLAELLSGYFGQDFGEHSSANCPVENAIDYINEIDIKELELTRPETTSEVISFLQQLPANTRMMGVNFGAFRIVDSDNGKVVQYC